MSKVLFYVINNIDDLLNSPPYFTRLERVNVFSRVCSQMVYFSVVTQMLQYETEQSVRILAMDGIVSRFLSPVRSYWVLCNLISPFRLSNLCAPFSVKLVSMILHKPLLWFANVQT